MWSSVLLFFTVLDIFKGLSTGFYDKRLLITDRNIVLKRYINNELPLDLLAVISVLINRAYFPNFNKTAAYVLNMLIFCKYYIVWDILNRIDIIF